MITHEDAQRVLQGAIPLYSKAEVEQAILRMAREIEQALGDRNPLVLCVMNGGLIPAGKLVPELNFPLQLDYIHATRYHGRTSGSDLHWRAEPQQELQDRVVLVIDDILDEGITLDKIVEYCREQGAREVYTAVLVEKLHERKPGMQHADFTGLQVEDLYVFGYGMDYKNYLRNAPGIFAVRE